MLYFAYGSNMDFERMNERKCEFKSAKPAKLVDWTLTFDKQSSKVPTMGFGNVIPKDGDFVEGILYDLDDGMIKVLDKFEGHPKHYKRRKISVICEGKDVEADIYIASPEWVKPGLKPSQEYLDHFLAGKDYLSPEYYEKLKKTPTI